MTGAGARTRCYNGGMNQSPLPAVCAFAASTLFFVGVCASVRLSEAERSLARQSDRLDELEKKYRELDRQFFQHQLDHIPRLR